MSEKEKWQFKLKIKRTDLDIESKKNIRWIIIVGGAVVIVALWRVLY